MTSPDDLTTIWGMRDRLGREPTLGEVLDQIKRDHPDEQGGALVERLKGAIAIFRHRRETLGLGEEVPQSIRKTLARSASPVLGRRRRRQKEPSAELLIAAFIVTTVGVIVAVLELIWSFSAGGRHWR